ncbi:MAG: cytochrome P460 family protein [Acidobacteria bacterium]|nr:cytochrome P460 family protein [Acidobacteriota bacterium]
MRGAVLATILIGAGLLAAEVATVEPRFTEDNRMIRPEGYRQWIFLSSGLGMSYSKDAEYDEKPVFTNVYIRPEAYRQFADDGTFPDGTVLVLEIYSAASAASINKGGHFQDRFIGIEAAVKDTKRFPEKWAYFGFIGPDGKALPQAEAYPKEACWKCHDEHAAQDNVFLQFYPALREARAKKSNP